MRILVAGGTGFVGTHLCRELHERGHEVTAMARSPGEADLPTGVETVAGDVESYDSVDGHVAGHDAVVNLVALSPLWRPRGGDARHFEVHRDGTGTLVRAAEEHDVELLLQMSGTGADPAAPTAYLRAKGEAEEIVRESALSHVIFRPAVMFGEGGEFVPAMKKLAPPYVTPLPGGGETPFQPIWVRDVVPMLAAALEDDVHHGRSYEIAGPEVLTLAEVAGLAHEADGRSVRVLPVPMSLAKLGLSVGQHLPGFPLGADQARALEMENLIEDNDVEAFGVSEDELLRLEEYLRGAGTPEATRATPAGTD